MATTSILFALLEVKDDPTPKSWNETIESVSRDPKLIGGLTDDGIRDDFLILLKTHSHRLEYFFRHLLSFANRNPKSVTTRSIAAETVVLLTSILLDIHQLLEPAKILEFLLPALDVCFVSNLDPKLRKLGSVLTGAGSLLEHISSDRHGIEILRQWVAMQSNIALNAETLSLWTERLVTMMHNCGIDHDISREGEQWDMLMALKSSLQDLDHSTSTSSDRHSSPTTHKNLPELGSMMQLNKGDKKARIAQRDNVKIISPQITDHVKGLLKTFDLQIPGSTSQVRDVIKRLEGEKTTEILLLLTSKLPCYLCISFLGSPSQKLKGKTPNFPAASVSYTETLNKRLGLWKVLVSPQALKSLLHIQSHGLVGPVTEKLVSIASGCWHSQSQPRAGLKAQRSCLKVPIWKTSCGQNQFILWQIDIGTNAETEELQQEIKVWEVCHYSEISRILDRVIYLQQSYTDETIHRCLQHSTFDDVQLPASFADSLVRLTKSTRPSADLDIRTVDQNIIEMTNKFYALTEPMIRSIISNDLSAEFPFDLSGEEARVIRHFRTASLILGRSGTGKTTCLVFKLVGKFLASKAVADERPVQQVLLTRSPFLADKLSLYTRRLIESLSSKAAEIDSHPPSQHTLSNTVEEDLRDKTIFSLRDTSFPLVCTWEVFLRILENTAAKTKPQTFHELAEPTDQQPDEVADRRRSAYGQLVDFHAFKADYWPHFSQTLTKNLPVHLVFAEIMGVIKGSSSSRKSLEPLRREDYLAQSCRLAPTFVLEAERSRVYDVFKMYEKKKSELDGVDYVDRVINLLRALQQDPSLKQLLQYGFDEVYIDEIQDQRCLDIELLLNIIKDCRGFHFAGDTAQAISQDSTFRFSDIKALFFSHFAQAGVATNQPELARPEMFLLAKNYRSHEGILALASLIMSMIWKGFPETVDKLEPEIGHLNGPKPVLFCGIDSEILRSRHVGRGAVPEGAGDFGAEQVILVRDTRMKASLREEIGDVATILTILESKGMEFEDVMLWNFFSECPDQAGIRSLEILAKNTGNFNSRKYSAMCSELKHLYVAITRARVQFFIMESSRSTATTILKFLANHNSESLVHVTSPDQEDFGMRLEMLRPGTSLDPRQWSRRGAEFMHRAQYKDAIRCFRKAQDICGETTAQGHQQEEEARRCNAEKNIEGFIQNLDLALDCFTKENLVNDRARVLVALGKPQDAAEILFQDKKYSKAASLFMDAGLSSKAIDCHHLAGECSEAAAILNKERNYDRLVSYLDENRGSIPASTLQGYSLLCKLLLKQNKTSTEYRKYAVRLLGSSTEQEKCFLEYGMSDELADLYASQLRYKDLFHFHSRNGRLEQALSLATTHNLLQSSDDGLEPEVLNLLDYVWMGYLEKHILRSAAPLNLQSKYLTPNVALRAKQWEAINTLYSLNGIVAGHDIATMESTVPKTVLCLRKILNTGSITRATKLDDLPLEMMQEVVMFVRALTLDKNGDALKTVYLLTGLWKPRDGKGRFIVLPWSPIRHVLAHVDLTDPSGAVIEEVLDRLVTAILTLDTKAKILWKEKWLIRCIPFMTFGCSRMRNGQECHRLHQHVHADDCERLLGDLLRINSVFCDLAVLHYRRSLNEDFRGKYLGIKRHWMERLSRELIYLSSVEQQTGAIMRSQTELFCNQRFVAVSYYLEVLLYYRLNFEWNKRSNFTALVEHLQLAEAFGSRVQHRHFRALSQRLCDDQRQLLQRHLNLLCALKENVGGSNVSIFQNHLNTFLMNLDNIDVAGLSTFHALTAVFEYLASHLILRLCTIACVVPNSWIDLHIESTSKPMHSPKPLQGDDKYRVQECLVHLGKSFCGVLSRMNLAAQPRDFLVCSGNSHSLLLLRHRNAELVAILLVNLAATSPQLPKNFNELWFQAQQVFELDFVRASHLRCRNHGDLAQILAPSLAKYNQKNSLVVVVKDRSKGPVFSNLEGQPGVKTVPFDHLFPPAPTSIVTETPPDQNAHTATPVNAEEERTHDQYSTAETEDVIKIQRRWRSVSLKIKKRRSYVPIPECRALARFFNLCPIILTGTKDNQKAIRKLLLSQTVALSLRLDAAKALLTKLQEDTMTLIENVVIVEGVDKSVDDILCRNREVESLMGKAERNISDEVIKDVVATGDVAVLEERMDQDVRGAVVEAEQMMEETRQMIEAVLRSCTQEEGVV